jgi:hypothetical protein
MKPLNEPLDMSSPDFAKSQDEEVLLVRNVDLARQRLIRRGGELELLLRQQSMSRKERRQRLSYAMSGLSAAHAELRDAVQDLATFGGDERPSSGDLGLSNEVVRFPD